MPFANLIIIRYHGSILVGTPIKSLARNKSNQQINLQSTNKPKKKHNVSSTYFKEKKSLTSKPNFKFQTITVSMFKTINQWISNIHLFKLSDASWISIGSFSCYSAWRKSDKQTTLWMKSHSLKYAVGISRCAACTISSCNNEWLEDVWWEIQYFNPHRIRHAIYTWTNFVRVMN